MPDPLNPHYDDIAVFYDSDFFYADGQPDNPPTIPKPKHMAKLKQKLSRRTPENLVALAELVHPKCAPAAPATPPVPGVVDETAALLAACAASKTANTNWAAAKVTLEAMAQIRRDKGDELRAAHDNLGAVLEAKSHGSAAALTATGYELAETPTASTTPPERILNLNLTAGDEDATVDASCDPDGKASSYEWQVTVVHPVDGPWTAKDPTTSSSATLRNLTSGSRIWVRVRGIGAKGSGPWSDPATKIVP